MDTSEKPVITTSTSKRPATGRTGILLEIGKVETEEGAIAITYLLWVKKQCRTKLEEEDDEQWWRERENFGKSGISKFRVKILGVKGNPFDNLRQLFTFTNQSHPTFIESPTGARIKLTQYPGLDTDLGYKPSRREQQLDFVDFLFRRGQEFHHFGGSINSTSSTPYFDGAREFQLLR